MEKIKIVIEGVELEIKQSFRSLMMFEEMTAKGINQFTESVADILKLFYCIIKANNQSTFHYSFDEFLDVMDNHPDAFEQFNQYLADQAKNNPPVTEQKKSNKKLK